MCCSCHFSKYIKARMAQKGEYYAWVGGIWKVRNNVTMFWGIGHELWNGISTTMFSISLLTIMTVVKNTTQTQIPGLGIHVNVCECSVAVIFYYIYSISKVDYF